MYLTFQVVFWIAIFTRKITNFSKNISGIALVCRLQESCLAGLKVAETLNAFRFVQPYS